MRHTFLIAKHIVIVLEELKGRVGRRVGKSSVKKITLFCLLVLGMLLVGQKMQNE